MGKQQDGINTKRIEDKNREVVFSQETLISLGLVGERPPLSRLTSPKKSPMAPLYDYLYIGPSNEPRPIPLTAHVLSLYFLT